MIDIDKAVREVLRELVQPQCVGPSACEINPFDIPRKLEHSLLTVGLTREELLKGCRMARSLSVAAVCVAPYYVADATEALTGSPVVVCAAVGFPSALISTEAKIADVRACVTRGASEIDLAIDVAAVKSGNIPKAEKDFYRAAQAAQGYATVKAVFEHSSFTGREKEAVLLMIGRSGVPFIKIQNMTSGHGARCEEIRLVRDVLGDKIKIKIDGGVKTLEHALELFSSGASRIGLTATRKIAEEATKNSIPVKNEKRL